MPGVPPRCSAFTPSRRGALAVVFAALFAFAGVLPAQTPADEPALPASTDPAAPPSSDAGPALPPYAPSDNAASPLLPASPPLPPHPSIPTLSLLPDSTPAPVPSPFPLPVPAQTGPTLSPAADAPGSTPIPLLPGGATSTTNTGAVRRFQYAFRLSTGVTYDDNLFLTGDNPTTTTSKTTTTPPAIGPAPRNRSGSDVFFSISPAVSLGYGDFLSRATNFVEFDYNADALLFTKNTDQDTVQHFLNLQGAYHFAQVTLTLSQGVQILDSTDLSASGSTSLLAGGAAGSSPSTPSTQVNLDASQRTGLDIFTTRLDANYAFSDKTSVDLDAYFSAYDYQSLISSDTISADTFFNYSPTGKITLGLGVTGGYVIQDKPAPDEFYQQINLRLSYVPTGKLTFAGTLGLEFRETSGVGSVVVNPVFDLTVSYAPFDSTALSLIASRRVDTSAVLTGEDFDSTGFTLTVSQRFFQRAYARLSVGYTHSSYVSTGEAVTTNREEDYYFVQPGLDYTIRDNISASLFYIHRQNISSLSGNGFNDNQIGARISLNF